MSTSPTVPFNRPALWGRELDYIAEAVANGHLSGDGPFSKRCEAFLERRLGCAKVLLTHSCTAALEMSALLADIQPGDEVIMPSFTFVSTANAFVLRGAVPVFVDIREDTLNIDESLIAAALTPRTRAVVPVHYAGVGCDMDPVLDLARKHDLFVIEDAAQGLGSTQAGRPLGGMGQLGALSFHETKNVISGEGGALLIDDPALVERAEILREKGTNRSRFHRGEVDKYTWVDLGSSFLPSELIAAFLWAQLEHLDAITERRKAIWSRYYEALADLEAAGQVRRPIVPPDCEHNGHLFYLLLPSTADQRETLRSLSRSGINAVFHYVPLHSAPAGKRYGRAVGELDVTDNVAERLIRLPLHPGLSNAQVSAVIESVRTSIETSIESTRTNASRVS